MELDRHRSKSDTGVSEALERQRQRSKRHLTSETNRGAREAEEQERQRSKRDRGMRDTEQQERQRSGGTDE